MHGGAPPRTLITEGHRAVAGPYNLHYNERVKLLEFRKGDAVLVQIASTLQAWHMRKGLLRSVDDANRGAAKGEG